MNPEARRSLLLSQIDTTAFGLEIGAGFNPLLPKAAGYRVETLDHASRDELVRKYAGAAVDTSRIEEVDHVCAGGSMVAAIGARARYRYIVASHVIEHTTDLIGFLRDCEALLDADGVLLLAVPDKRFSFDVLRPLSSTGDVLQAHVERRTRHTPGRLFDEVAYNALRGSALAWSREDAAPLAFFRPLADAKAMFEQACTSDAFHDIHAWQFTPSSFRLVVNDLHEIGCLGLRERSYVGDGLDAEFVITLSRDGGGPPLSRLELAERMVDELCAVRTSTSVPAADVDSAFAVSGHDAQTRSATSQLRDLIDRQRHEIARLNGQLRMADEQAMARIGEQQRQSERLRGQLDSMHASRSWRLTALLRAAASALRSLPPASTEAAPVPPPASAASSAVVVPAVPAHDDATSQARDRRTRILEGLPLAQTAPGRRIAGAEIGPLYRPLVTRRDAADGVVVYVDHEHADALRKRWSIDPTIDAAKIEVDAVWGARTLREAIDACELARRESLVGCPLDYVIASHVIEHVPDLVTWLCELHDVLRADGSLRLAVLDKRYSFDVLRRTSTFAEVADAYIRKRRAPSASRVLDFRLHAASVDCAALWAGRVDTATLLRDYTPEQALSAAAEAENDGIYHEVRCWVFTPRSFVDLCAEMAAAGLLAFECRRVIPTAHNELEFFVWMSPCDNRERATASWRSAGERGLAAELPRA